MWAVREEDTEKGRITGIQGGMKTERKTGHGKKKAGRKTKKREDK